MKLLRIITLGVILVLGFFASSSFAFSFSSIKSDEDKYGQQGLGLFEGELRYNALSKTEATLEVILKNTSPVDNGGFITAFAFDGLKGLSVSDFRSNTAFKSFITEVEGAINAKPFHKQFDFGATLDPKGTSWQGGGKPRNGIGVGSTETFTFNISGTALDELTAESFIDNDSMFAVRFRGFNNGKSDKVRANPDLPVGVNVPEPTTVFLLGVGLLGLASLRKKVRK